MPTEIRQIQVRRDTAANWTTANPTLESGEIGYETDTGKFKIGDGSTAWVSITDYFMKIPAAVSPTELGYLDGVTSAIQTQLGAKQATLVSATNIKTVNGSSLLGSGDLVVSGGVGGSVGSTDNAVPRADGTGGSTLQSSGVTIDDSNNVSTPGTIKSTLFQSPNGSDMLLRSAAGGGDLKIQNAFLETGLQFGDNRRVKLWALQYATARPAQITSNQNDYAMGNANATVVYINSDAARNITGIASSLGTGTNNTEGQRHRLINNGSFAITLKHEDGASTAANRFLTTTAADVVLAANQACDIDYDATAARWRVYKLT
jgi:hypothetical protein